MHAECDSCFLSSAGCRYYETEDFYTDPEKIHDTNGSAVGLLLGQPVVDLNIRLKRIRLADGACCWHVLF